MPPKKQTFEKGDIPTTIANIPGRPKIVTRQYLFPIPKEPLNGVFSGEEFAGVSVEYKFAPRYNAWLLHSTKTFIGNL